jgi:UDP-glucose 4-epimerase
LQVVEWADEIFHLAACVGQKFILKRPVYTITNNIQGCEKVLKAMDKVDSKARLLITSTSELYCHSEEGEDGTTSEESIVPFPPHNFLQDTYPVAKYVNEIMALSYAHEKGLNCSIARIFNTVGVNQTGFYGMVVPTFINQAIHNKPITVYGDGKQTRSFVDVRDTVVALDLLLSTPECRGEIVNVGNDKEFSILDLAHLVKRKTNSQSEIRFIDYTEAYGVPFVDVRRRQPNLNKLKRLTGFKHKWTIEDTIDNILSNKQYLDRLLGKGKI